MELFFATLIGAFISLLGVVLTLRHNQKAHEENLKDEQKKRREEKEFRAKQDVLIQASEAFTRFLTYFMTLPDRQLPQDGNVDPEVIELGVAINKLHFYCSLNTIKSSILLSQILNKVFSEAMRAKMPSAFIFEELKALNQNIEGLEKSNSVIQEEIRVLLLSEPHSSIIVRHRKQLAQNFQQISDCHGKKVELIKKKYQETEKCRDVVSKNIKIIYEASRDVLLMAREELEFPIDEIKYKTIMDESIKSMSKDLEDLYFYIRSEVEKRII